MKKNKKTGRCSWCTEDKIYQKYHDEEWGIPKHKDKELFELLCLEINQAGLSWITILKKREEFRKAFDKFNIKKITSYKEEKIQELLQNEKIIRNKRKIEAVINNAKVFLEIQKEEGSFDKYIWSFVNNKQIKNNYKTQEEVPTKNELSIKISKDLKKRGMTFVGHTIIYSYLEAIGIINNHTKDCFLYHKKIQKTK